MYFENREKGKWIVTAKNFENTDEPYIQLIKFLIIILSFHYKYVFACPIKFTPSSLSLSLFLLVFSLTQYSTIVMVSADFARNTLGVIGKLFYLHIMYEQHIKKISIKLYAKYG